MNDFAMDIVLNSKIPYKSIQEINSKLNENHNKLQAMILMMIIPKESANIFRVIRESPLSFSDYCSSIQNGITCRNA